MASAGELTVQVRADIADLKRDLGRVEAELKGLNTTTQKVSDAFAVAGKAFAAAFAVREIAQVAGAVFELGAAAGETASKFETVMGPAASAADASLRAFANTAGLTQTEARGLSATFASVAQGMGSTQQASADLAIQATQLAADFASFNNVPIAQAMNAITSAATGEREALKTLGVVLSEAEVKAAEATAEFEGMSRAAVTLELITRKAGVAIGDLDRTQDSAANRARRLGAEFREVRESLAVALIPAFESLLSAGKELIPVLEDIAGELTGTKDASTDAGRMVGELKDAVLALGVALGGSEDNLFAFKSTLSQIENEAGRATRTLGGLARLWNDLRESFTGGSVSDLAQDAVNRRTGLGQFGPGGTGYSLDLFGGTGGLGTILNGGVNPNDPMAARIASRTPPVATTARPTGVGSVGSARAIGRAAAAAAVELEAMGKALAGLDAKGKDLNPLKTALAAVHSTVAGVAADGRDLAASLTNVSTAAVTSTALVYEYQVAFDALRTSVDGVAFAFGDALGELLSFETPLSNIKDAGEALGRSLSQVFQRVVADIGAAIARALILRGILALTGGGGFLGSAVASIGGSALGKAAAPTINLKVSGGEMRMGNGYLVAAVRAGLEYEKRAGLGPGSL